MYGPRLQGSLVTLRPPLPQDAERFVEWLSDADVTRTLGNQSAPTLEYEREWLAQRRDEDTSVFWCVEYEGRHVGSTGIWLIDWTNRHAKTGTVIGDKSVWNRGIAGEAMRLRTRYAFETLDLHKLYSGYLDGNEASWRAQRSAGYREVGRHREHFFRAGRWIDEVLTEVLRSDWEAKQQ
jgi:RimJ/RimL family protein N-acetyltransferase